MLGKEADLRRDFLNLALALKKDFNYSNSDLLNIISSEILLPVGIFTLDNSPLSSLVSYLKDVSGLSFSVISKKIGRSYQTVWSSYKKCDFSKVNTSIYIPLSAISNDFSILEGVVLFLHEILGLKQVDVGLILSRDKRTIWTVLFRAKKKLARLENNTFGGKL